MIGIRKHEVLSYLPILLVLRSRGPTNIKVKKENVHLVDIIRFISLFLWNKILNLNLKPHERKR